MSRQPLSPDEKRRRLQKALARENWYSWEDAIAKCRDGVFQFLDAPECACITHIITRTDGRRACSIVAAGGTMRGIRDMVGQVEHFAREHGCASVTWSGRRGWDRVYAAMSSGYRPVAVVYEKDLSNAEHPEGNQHD